MTQFFVLLALVLCVVLAVGMCAANSFADNCVYGVTNDGH